MRTRRRLTQKERVEQSARRLMDAAIELIAEQGYERTTAAEIADRAGYSHSMVAARYGSKEALLAKLVENEYETRMRLPANAGEGLGALLAWIEHIRDQLRTDPRLMRAFFTLIFESAGPVPVLRPWTRDWLERSVADVTREFHHARRTGGLSAHVDIEFEAELYVLSAVGFGFRFVTDGDADRFDRALAGWVGRLEVLAGDHPAVKSERL